MKTKTLSYRIWMLSSLLFICLAVLAVTSVTKSKNIQSSLTHVSETILPASKYMTYADMMHDGIRGVVMESVVAMYGKDKEKLAELTKEVEEKSKEFLENIDQLNKTNISKSSKDAIAETVPAINHYAELSKLTVSLASTLNVEKTKDSLKPFNDSFKELEDKMEKLGGLIEKESQVEKAGGDDAKFWIYLVSVLSCVIGVITTIYMVRKITTEMSSVVTELVAVQHQTKEEEERISKTSTMVTASTTEQAAAVQESVASLTHMNELGNNTFSSVKESERLSQNVNNKSNESSEVMNELLKSMQNIEKSNLSLQEISKYFQDIISKTEMINDIVMKTQLLSFNASIEAARAGNSGNGFAVIAEEMSSLAVVSGNAASEISSIIDKSKSQVVQIIDDISQKVKKGTEVCGTATTQFNEIAQFIKHIETNIKQVTVNTQAQIEGIQQTLAAMKQMDVSSKENAKNSNEVMHSSEQLSLQSKKLNNVVETLQKLVVGEKSKELSA